MALDSLMVREISSEEDVDLIEVKCGDFLISIKETSFGLSLFLMKK